MKITVEFEFPDSDTEANKAINVALSEIPGVMIKIINALKTGEFTFDVIERSVCDYAGTTPEVIQTSKRQSREVVQARQICHHIAKNLHLGSLAAIGARFGNKDHATVLHSNRTVLNLLRTNVEFRNQYKSFIESFQ